MSIRHFVKKAKLAAAPVHELAVMHRKPFANHQTPKKKRPVEHAHCRITSA